MKTKVEIVGVNLFYSFLIMFTYGCTSAVGKKASETPAVKVHTETFIPVKGKLQSTLKIPAELEADREVEIYAKVNSYIKSLPVDVGSKVQAGQLLASLDAPELIAQSSSSEEKAQSQEAVFASSDATYQRILETSKTPGTISKNDVQIALAKRNSDLAELKAAKANLNASKTFTQYLNIRAPFSGVISARNVNLGAFTGPAGKGSDLPIFTLQDVKKLRLIILVPEAYKTYIALNDHVKFTVEAYPGQLFTARISRRSGVMNRRLRSEHIELDVLNDDLKLSPGMVAEAVLNLSGDNNDFVVPKSAVINSGEGTFMIRINKGKTLKVAVNKGRETDSLTEVFSDNITHDALFVKHASEELRDGSTIN